MALPLQRLPERPFRTVSGGILTCTTYAAQSAYPTLPCMIIPASVYTTAIQLEV